MRRFAIGLLGLGLAVILSTSAQAGLLSGALTFDGIEDQIQDNSVARILDVDGSGTLTVGDIVQGIVRLETNTTGGFDVPKEIMIVFSARIASGPAPGAFFGNGLSFTHDGVDPAGANVNALANLFPGFTFPAFVPGSIEPIAAIFSNPAPAGSNLTTTTFATAVAKINGTEPGWMLDLVAGLDSSGVGGTNPHGSVDFFEVEFKDRNGNGAIDLTEYGSLLAGGTMGEEAAVFTVLSQPGLGSGVIWLGVSANNLADTTTFTGDLAVPATALLKPNTTQLGNFWATADQATILANPAPEPSSLILLTLGLAGVGGVGFRRRKNAKA